MTEISLDKIKKIEVEILKDVTTFCENNNLRYSLASGTLLGAIRHNGFIPWDDDIDIIMPRPDYIKFISMYPKFCNINYNLTVIDNNKHHLYTFAKVFDKRTIKIEDNVSYNSHNIGGIEIDIFPMDGLPNSEDRLRRFYKKQNRLFMLYTYSISKFKLNKNIIKFFAFFIITLLSKIIGKRQLIKSINKNSMKYEFDKSDVVAVSVAPYRGVFEIAKKDSFSKYIEVTFEGELFKAPIGYDEYLTNVYGDYMKLPPLEERVTHHAYKAYIKENVNENTI